MPHVNKCKLFRGLAALIASLVLMAATVAAATAADQASELKDLTARADALFAQRENPSSASQAVKLYKQILEAQPDNQHVSVRLTWLLVFMGTTMKDKDQEAKYYEEATKVAELGAEHHPNSPASRYWLGVAYGLTADCSGPFAGMCLVPPIKDEMEALLKQAPDYEYGGAYRVLGRLYTKLPGLLGGDLDKAEEYLRKAVELGPKFWLNHLYLAHVLAEKGRCEDAMKLVEMAAKGEPVPGMEPESKLWRKHAAKVLEEVERGDSTDLVLAKCSN